MRNSLRRASMAALALMVAGSVACEKKDADDKMPLGAAPAAAPGAAAAPSAKPEAELTADSKVQLEAGNVAYRKKEYAAAKAAYEKAAAGSPDHAAPWFGIYMVAKATNDAKGADAALAEIRKRNEAPPMEHNLPDTGAMKKAHAKAGVGTTKS